MELENKTVKELRELAKEHDIVGRWDMNKSQLIEALSKVDDEKDCVINDEVKTNPEGSQKVTKTTLDYLNSVPAGTLVAFKRSEKNIAMSGKLVEITTAGKVIVQSKKGTMFNLYPENIIWVKTGIRWPKWVFSLFNHKDKGVDDDNAISEVYE